MYSVVCHRKDLRMGEVRNSDLERPENEKRNHMVVMFQLMRIPLNVHQEV